MKVIPVLILSSSLFLSCQNRSTSSTDDSNLSDSLRADSVFTKSSLTSTADTTISENAFTKPEKPAREILEIILGKWVFVKSFLPAGQSIDSKSFTIIRRQFEPGSYGYFVHFVDGEQEYLLQKVNESTVEYDNYGIFKYDVKTDHLFVQISETSNAEYKRF